MIYIELQLEDTAEADDGTLRRQMEHCQWNRGVKRLCHPLPTKLGQSNSKLEHIRGCSEAEAQAEGG